MCCSHFYICKSEKYFPHDCHSGVFNCFYAAQFLFMIGWNMLQNVFCTLATKLHRSWWRSSIILVPLYLLDFILIRSAVFRCFQVLFKKQQELTIQIVFLISWQYFSCRVWRADGTFHVLISSNFGKSVIPTLYPELVDRLRKL